MKNRMTQTLRTICLAGALALGSLAATDSVSATTLGVIADEVTLKDGTVLEGTIVRELDGNIWLELTFGSLKQTKYITADEIKAIQRDSVEPEMDEPTRRRDATQTAPASTGPKKRGVVISLEEMVGMYMDAEPLKRAIPWLEKNDIDVVVLKVNSGGGYLLGIQPLSDVIHNEYKKKFEVVSWIESAISAAAMSTLCVEEIYFMPEGNFGACTGWSGALEAVKGRGLEEVLHQMEPISRRGNHNPYIMKAMQHDDYPLSYSKDENGDITWFQNESGDVVLNRQGRILTLLANNAEDCGFSMGTARTLDQLESLMNKGDIEWVGRWEKGGLYPISGAEEIQIDYRERVKMLEQRLGEFWTKYGITLGFAQGAPEEDRGAFVGKARDQFQKITSLVENNPNFIPLILGMLPRQYEEWKYEQDKLLRELAK